MDIKIYLKAAAALAVMGTVSFMVFDGLLGRLTDRREPVAASALTDGGADYVPGQGAVTAIAEAVALKRSPLKGTPFANSYRLSEDVAGRVYKNGLDVDGEIRMVEADGGWKAPSYVRSSRQLPPDTWEPRPIAPAAEAARCPTATNADPLVGALHFARGGARPLAVLPPPLKSGDRLIGCIEVGKTLPLSLPGPVMTEAVVKGEVSHRGRPAILFDISGRAAGWDGVKAYGGYALVDRDTALVVFSDIQASFADPAAHGGYTAEIREQARVDLR